MPLKDRSIGRIEMFDRAAAPVFVAVVLLAVLLRFLIDPRRINDDAALYLTTGQLILKGRMPYVDFVDINPPLIMYLNVVPAAIARWLSLSPIVVLNVLVWSLVVGSTMLIRHVLRLRPNRSNRTESLVLIAWVSVNAYVAWIGSWGQREQLFVVLYVPFFVLRSLGEQRRRVPTLVRVSLGVAAALGACLKPGFLVIVAAPEIYWMLRRVTRRPISVETAAFATTGFAYAAHFLLVPTAMRRELFGRWLPLISQRYNNAYGVGIVGTGLALVRYWAISACLLAAAVTVLLVVRDRWSRSGPLVDLVTPLVLMSLAALGYYLYQRKGWPYQAIPFGMFAALAFAAAIGQVWDQIADSRERKSQQKVHISRFVLFLALTTCVAVGEVGPALYARSQHAQTPIEDIVGRFSNRGDPVLIFSTSVKPASTTLLRTDRRPGSRYLWMFPIALFEGRGRSINRNPYPRPAIMSPGELRFVDDVEADIAVMKPTLIVVQRGGCQGCVPGFQLLTYLERSGIEQMAMRAYTRVGQFRGWVAFAR
jgi:hypothetical protein